MTYSGVYSPDPNDVASATYSGTLALRMAIGLPREPLLKLIISRFHLSAALMRIDRLLHFRRVIGLTVTHSWCSGIRWETGFALFKLPSRLLLQFFSLLHTQLSCSLLELLLGSRLLASKLSHI